MSTSTDIDLDEYLLKKESYCNKLKEEEANGIKKAKRFINLPKRGRTKDLSSKFPSKSNEQTILFSPDILKYTTTDYSPKQKKKANTGTKRPNRNCALSSCNITNLSVPKRSFFSFSSVNKNHEKTDLWIKAVQEVNGPTWFPKVSSFICNDHFVNGQHRITRTDVNYVPTLFPVIRNNVMIGNSNFKKIITNVKANLRTGPEDTMDVEASENVSDGKTDLLETALIAVDIKASEFLKIEHNMQEDEADTKMSTNKIGNQKKLNHSNSHKRGRPEIIRSKSPSKLDEKHTSRCSVLECSVTNLSTPKRSFFSFPSVNKTLKNFFYG